MVIYKYFHLPFNFMFLNLKRKKIKYLNCSCLGHSWLCDSSWTVPFYELFPGFLVQKKRLTIYEETYVDADRRIPYIFILFLPQRKRNKLWVIPITFTWWNEHFLEVAASFFSLYQGFYHLWSKCHLSRLVT